MSNTTEQARTDFAEEIAQAIRSVSTPTDSDARIRILPSMPEFQYRHTCPKCGCHLATPLWIEPDPYEPLSKICLHCQHVYESAKEQAI